MHVLEVTATGVLVHRGDGLSGYGPRRVVRVGIQGGYTGWVIPVHPATRSSSLNQRSGPRKPLQGAGVGGLRRAAGPASPDEPWDHHSRPSGPSGPASLSQASRQGGGLAGCKRRDFSHISVKLVKTAECHQICPKRPVIVPVLKTGSRIHLLKFQDFRFPQPSLTRN